MDRYEYYNKFNVGVLRGIARDIGVSTPTTKTKRQIITEVLNIENGLQQPQLTVYGRKPKQNPLKDLEVNIPKKNENYLANLYKQSIKLNLIEIISSLNSIVEILDKIK